jgi:hypothetical protein
MLLREPATDTKHVPVSALAKDIRNLNKTFIIFSPIDSPLCLRVKSYTHFFLKKTHLFQAHRKLYRIPVKAFFFISRPVFDRA